MLICLIGPTATLTWSSFFCPGCHLCEMWMLILTRAKKKKKTCALLVNSSSSNLVDLFQIGLILCTRGKETWTAIQQFGSGQGSSGHSSFFHYLLFCVLFVECNWYVDTMLNFILFVVCSCHICIKWMIINRLHLRSGTAQNPNWSNGGNNGCNSDRELQQGVWTHLTLIHDSNGERVWLQFFAPIRNSLICFVSFSSPIPHLPFFFFLDIIKLNTNTNEGLLEWRNYMHR